MNICITASVVARRLLKTLRRKSARFAIAGFCVALLCCWQSPDAKAQPGMGSLSNPLSGDTSADDFSGSVTLGSDGSYLVFNQYIGDRLGYQDGFSQFGLFTPLLINNPNNVLFGMAFLSVSDHTRVGALGGFGYRHYFDQFGRILGVHSSFMTDDSINGFRYNQVNAGVEWLGDAWDLRSNVYIPVDRQDNKMELVSMGTVPTFRDGQLVYLNQRAYEEQLMGGDIELGVPIPTQSWLKAFIGAYYYDTTNPSDMVGVSGRVTARVSTDTSLFVGITEDEQFGTNFTGGVSIAFNGSTGYQLFPTRTIDQRMFDQVVQNYRISQNVYTQEETSPVINPDTNSPFTIIWVDNSNPNPGDGSFDNPFQEMHAKMCSDIIFVRTGTTTAINPLVSEFILCDDQRLLGEGLPHLILGSVVNIPGVAINGPRPFITTGPGGDIVTLANRNEVSGLNLISPTGGTAITNNFAIQNTNINNVNVTGLGSGIDIKNIRGQAAIVNSSFLLTGAPSPGAISIVNNNQNPLALNIDGVTISGGERGIRLSASNSVINGLLNNVTDNISGTGLVLTAANNGALNITMNNTSFSNATGAGAPEGDGIFVLASNGGDVFIDATDTTLFNNLDDAIDISTLSGGTFNGVFNNGDWSQSGDNGIEINTDASTGNTFITNNVDSSDSGNDGLHVEMVNNSSMLIDITNGDFSGAGGDANDLLVDSGSNLNIHVDPTPGTGAGEHGILARVFDGAILTALYEDTDFSGAGLDGLHLEVAGNNATANLTFDNFDFSNTVTGDGFDFSVSDGQMNATFTNGTFNDAAANGIIGSVGNNSTATLNMTNVTDENATLFAICVDVFNQSTFNGNFTNVSFANAGMGPTCFNVDGNSTVNLVFDNVNFNGPGLMCGIDFVVTGGSTYNVSVLNSNLSNFLHSAVCGDVIGPGSNATVTLEDVFADNSGMSGIDLFADQGSITLNTTDTSIDNSGLDGVMMVLVNGATGEFTIEDTTIENSDRHGINVDATNSTLSPSSLTDVSLDGSGMGGAGNALNLDFDNSTANLVQLVNTTGDNAADDGLFINAINGSIVNADIMGGSFDNAGDNAMHAELVDNSLVTISTDGTTGENAGINGLLVNGTIGSTFTGTFIDGSFDMANTGNAVEINLDNSDGTITMDNVTGANAGLNGFLANLDNGAELNGTINDGSFSDNGNNAIRLLLDNASSGNLSFTDTPGANSVADGLFFDLDNTSDLTLSVVNGNFDNSGVNAIFGTLDINSQASILLNNVSAENAQEDGLLVNASNLSVLDLTTIGGSFDNAGQDGAAANRNGIELNFDNSTALLDMDGTTASDAPHNGLLLNFDNGALLGTALDPASIANGSFLNAGINAVQANFDNVSIGFLDLTDTTGANAGADGFIGNVDNASELTVNVIGGSFSDNGDNALDFNIDNGSLVDITMQGTTNENSVNDGLQFNADNASTFNGNFVSSSFNNSGGNGIIGVLDNASISDLQLTNTTVDDAGIDALSITATNGSDFTGIVTGGSFVNAGVNALEFNIDNSTAAFTLDGAPANNAGQNGLEFNVTNGGVFGTALQPVTILNSSFESSGHNAVQGFLDTASSGAVTMDNTSGFESGFDGMNLDVRGGSDLIFAASNASFGNSGQDALSPLSERNAINLNVIGASTLDLTLTNIDANNTVGNSTQENGLLFNVSGASTLTADISSTIANAPSNYSNNNVNAVQGTLTGTGTLVDISMDGITADNSGEDGVHIVQTDESTLDFDILGSVNASSVSNSGGHGIFATVTGNGAASDTNASFTFDNVTIDNNGQDNLLGGDGINLSGSAGGAIDLTTDGGSVSTNRDVGIRIAVIDDLSPFTLNMNGTTVDSNINGEGLLANVTNGGLFDATIVDGSFSNNGTGTPSTGFKVSVSGTNGGGTASTGNITFDGTAVNGNTIHGMEYLANLGAELNVSLNNGVSVSDNRFSGISFQVFDANTVASLTMTGDNVISNNGVNTDFDGIDIDVVDANNVTLSIAGTVQGNGNDGVNINATNTIIDALSITGSIIENGAFAGGQGSGVNINLDNTTVNDFSVINANIDDNTGDGLVLGAVNGSLISNGNVTLSTFSGNSGGSGIVLDLTDSDAPDFRITDNTNISDNDENGIVVRLNNSPLTGLTIADNFNLDNGNLIEGISNNGLNGVLFDLDDSKLTDLEFSGNFIDANQGGDGARFEVTDSDIQGMIDGNTITNNFRNGIAFDELVSSAPTMTIDFGDVANDRYITNNVISGNDRAGIYINLDSNMNFLAQLGGNTIDDNNVGFRLRAHRDATFTTEFGNALLPVAANTFSGNLDAGIDYELRRQFLGDTVDVVGNIIISDVTITGTVDGTSSILDGSGIHIIMNDKAVLNTAIIENQNAVIGSNAGDGITIEIADDAEIPDLQIRDAQITGNDRHGINIQRTDRSTIVGTIENITATDNALDGFHLFATNRQTPELLFNFNDNNFSDNGQDGMSFETEADVILRLNGNRNTISGNERHGMLMISGEDSAIGNPLTATNSVFNNSIITGNGQDGVNIRADNNSRILIDFLSPVDPLATDRTQITDNGNNGVTLVSNSTSELEFSILGADVTGNVVDGLNATTTSSSLMTMTIGGAGPGEDNVFSENGDDGLSFNALGSNEMIVTAIENIINFNGTDADSIGDNGVSIVLAGTSNFTGTFTDNTMNNNEGRGLSYLATGQNGTQPDDSEPLRPDNPVDLILVGNTLNANALQGIFFEADSNFAFNRTVAFSNTGFPDDDRPFPSPFDPVLLATPDYTPTNGFGSSYLNTRTRQATDFVLANNTIRDNGTGIDSDGVLMRVGTASYVSADVQSNIFGGNVLSDFRTQSFVSLAPSVSSSDTSGSGTFDIVALNDTAQLDLRFNLNTGDQISPSSAGAASLFQVDDGPNLDFPNNDFEQFSIQQDIDGAFSSGGYHLRGAADPLFPNPAFPPFLP